MPLIKTIATRKKKSGNALFEPNRKKPKSNDTWYGGSKSNVVKAKNSRGGKAKNGRVKKVTKLTAEFVSAASGKKVKISAQANSGRKSKVNSSSARTTNMIFGEKQSHG